MSAAGSATPLRERLKEETRQIILEAFAACLAETEIDKVTYADVAARAGVGERTVYRHFQTRDELLRALYAWLSRKNGDVELLPQTEADLTGRLQSFFQGFDDAAPVMKAAVITPQGYEMRMANREERQDAFLAALAHATSGLSPLEKRMAAGVVQHIHSASAWLALREGWELSGEDAARACEWAIGALLKDLKRRRGEVLT